MLGPPGIISSYKDPNMVLPFTETPMYGPFGKNIDRQNVGRGEDLVGFLSETYPEARFKSQYDCRQMSTRIETTTTLEYVVM